MIKYVFGVLVIAICISCNKESSNKWEVESSGVVDSVGCLKIVINDNFSENVPVEMGQNCSNIVWEEDQVMPAYCYDFGQYHKQIIIEIPDSTGINSFNYNNEDIYSNLKVFVWHSTQSKYDGYYRIHKGFVSGQKNGNQWMIDFEVFYGGKDGNKFRMIKDATY